MLSQITESISQVCSYPEFAIFYQEYVKNIQDDIIENELNVNEYKISQLKNFNCVLTQLNELTEELRTL